MVNLGLRVASYFIRKEKGRDVRILRRALFLIGLMLPEICGLLVFL
jgi:hypothetical protein